jgi:integrase
MIHQRTVKRISTSLSVQENEITRSGRIKNVTVEDRCAEIIRRCRDFCNSHAPAVDSMSAEELKERLESHLQGRDGRFRLDFFSFAGECIAEMSEGSGRLYRTTVNTLKRFVGRNALDIMEINYDFLKKFERFISEGPSQRGSNRKSNTAFVEQNRGSRALSLYMSHVRHLYSLAKDVYNDEDRGIVRIPYSPFKKYRIKSSPATRKRALPADIIQKIIDLPYMKKNNGAACVRFSLARDCFLLSLALAGMNSVDMYSCQKSAGGILTYNRRKTESRRADRAEMRIRVEPEIARLAGKYADPERMFCFHRHYSSSRNFNRAINTGLKQIGKVLGVDGLEFYAARHSWATAACSAAAGIDRATVHEALNHVDGKMKVTDIYIDRDWTVIWNANRKVLSLFDWRNVTG